MSTDGSPETQTEAVGLFEDAETLQAAVDDLLSSGFDRAELSLLASEAVIDRELGHLYQRVADLEDDPGTPRSAYVSKESLGDAEGGLVGGLFYVGALAATGAVVASGGTMAAAITAAALLGGTGGLIGTLLAKLIDDEHAHHLQEHLDRGGLLLWVRTRDGAHEKKALRVLGEHSGHDVHLHSFEPPKTSAA
jgi:hypothetical protein